MLVKCYTYLKHLVCVCVCVCLCVCVSMFVCVCVCVYTISSCRVPMVTGLVQRSIVKLPEVVHWREI